ncbi:putative uncharacterized protein FLJ46214 [Eubalaena glacialis]|uniref:putative uncharacterized protein FLJ46214 n=1 Tax=Eubalaena glacialis TaxID=27606 RepID=UPI002A5AFF1F|nr:putative uncharacterized protein FLJ46214 [Eubalaena glacialis]
MPPPPPPRAGPRPSVTAAGEAGAPRAGAAVRGARGAGRGAGARLGAEAGGQIGSHARPAALASPRLAWPGARPPVPARRRSLRPPVRRVVALGGGAPGRRSPRPPAASLELPFLCRCEPPSSGWRGPGGTALTPRAPEGWVLPPGYPRSRPRRPACALPAEMRGLLCGEAFLPRPLLTLKLL